MFPIGQRESGAVEIASHRILETPELQEIADTVGLEIAPVLASRSDIAFALRRGYSRQANGQKGTPLGVRLIDDGLITDAQLQDALRDQRRGYLSLGAILIRNGFVTQGQMDEVTTALAQTGGRLGEALVSRGYCSEGDVEKALFEQRGTRRNLGEVLVANGVLSREQLESYLAQGAA